MKAVRGYLRDGRVLVHFGTSADLPYFNELVDIAGLSAEIISQLDVAGAWPLSYFVFRLTATHADNQVR